MSSCLKLGIHEFIGLVCVWGGCLVSALAQSEAEDAAVKHDVETFTPFDLHLLFMNIHACKLARS